MSNRGPGVGKGVSSDPVLEAESDYGSDLDCATVERLLSQAISDAKRPKTSVYGTKYERLLAAQPEPGLMRLPPELRNRIYQHLFEDTTIDLDVDHLHMPPGIVRACKQTCEEGAKLLYATATFTAKTPEKLLHALGKLRPEHRRVISIIGIDTVSHLRRGKPIRLDYENAEAAETDIWKVQQALTTDSFLCVRPKVVKASFKMLDGDIIWSETPTSTSRDLCVARMLAADRAAVEEVEYLEEIGYSNDMDNWYWDD